MYAIIFVFALLLSAGAEVTSTSNADEGVKSFLDSTKNPLFCSDTQDCSKLGLGPMSFCNPIKQSSCSVACAHDSQV